MIDYRIQVTEAEKRRVNEFISALRTDCTPAMHPKSELNSPEFEIEFRSKLLTHHCFMGSPLFMESFDSAFVAACKQAGHKTSVAPEGQRFWDITLNGRKISLKSSKAQSLRENKLTISKLTEAAWIQDCRTATMRQDMTFKLFNEYCSEVDAIIQLRYFKNKKVRTCRISGFPFHPNHGCRQGSLRS